MLKKWLALVFLAFFVSACANQALILSEPTGAQVYVDGQAVGKTPCKYKYATSTGSSFAVTVKKSGYDAINYRIKADETDVHARNGWLAAGLVWSPLWLGTLFTKKLKDSYDFVMKKAVPEITAKAEKPSPVRPF